MKLETCDWVPSHVVHWLSKKLEEKGVPGASYSHTLLSYLHPYFCPHPVSKPPKPKTVLGKELPRFEDFDDSIDSDADFPQENSNIIENKLSIKKIEWDPSRREDYHKRAVECLSSASDKIEELDQLVEELFEILDLALHEDKLGLSHDDKLISNLLRFKNIGRKEVYPLGRSLGSSDTGCRSDPSYIPRTLLDDINDGRSSSFNPRLSDHLAPMNCERSLRDNMGGAETSAIPGNFSGGVGTPSSMKEEWEYLAQLVNAQNGSLQQSGGARLFERASGTHDPFHHSPGLGLSRLENRTPKEPWKDSLSIWKTQNTLNANPAFNEMLPKPFGESFADNECSAELPSEHERPSAESCDNKSRLRFAAFNCLIPEGHRRALAKMNANEREPMNMGEQLQSAPTYILGEGEQSRQKNVEDELSKSFRQLGIDIWKDRREFFPGGCEELQFHANVPENCYKLPCKSARLEGMDSLADIPRGPAGPHAELNHTETSGFSSVVPHRDYQLAGAFDPKRMDAFGISDRYGCNEFEDKENLLTSPRTHFKPIKQDSQGSSEEDKDEVQVVSEAQTGFQNPEFLFQRTSSGNLILENDLMEGSPRKYMVYKEPQSKIVGGDSPYGASPSNLDPAAYSFAPKFKISNNEKFSQTEPSPVTLANNMRPFVRKPFNSPKNMDSIWESNFKENFKKIWNEEDNASGKEVWEIGLENMSLEFASSDQSWSKEEGAAPLHDSIPLKGFFKKREHERHDVLSRIKFLWPTAANDHSPVENTDRLEQGDSYLGSSWSKSFLSKDLEGKTDMYGEISWSTDMPHADDNTLRASDSDMSEKWKKWAYQESEDMSLAPMDLSASKKHPLDSSQDNAGEMEDLEILEPGWDLNEGFEWDPALVEEMDAESQEREVFYCEVDGQQVILPVEYLEDDLYDKYFGVSDPKIGGSLPDIPYSETTDGKKIPVKIKRKSSRAAHSNRPCTFYLEGNCLRTDCKFTHDLSAITCRFWEEDSCFKAETCPFLHGYPTHRKRNRSEGDQAAGDAVSLVKLKEPTKGSKGRAIKSVRPPPNSFKIDSEADFPSLGSSYESRTNSLEDIPKNTGVKSTGKKTKFVAVPTSFLKKLEVKGTTGKSSSQRRKKSKYDNARALRPSQVGSDRRLDSASGTNRFKSEIMSPKPSCHEDGTVSDF